MFRLPKAKKTTKTKKLVMGNQPIDEKMVEVIYQNNLFAEKGGESEDTKVINIKGFGCHTEMVKNLCKSLLKQLDREDVKVVSTDDENAHHVGTMVVPLKNPNSHNYILNNPVFIVHRRGKGIAMNNEVGNCLPTVNGTDARYATKEEIRYFLSHFDGVLVVSRLNK